LCWLTIPLGFALLAFAALQIDCRLSGWCVEMWSDKGKTPHIFLTIRDILGVMENFGYGWGVAIILLTVFVLNPANRWALPRLICCVIGSGFLAANGLKLLLSRARPHSWDFVGDIWNSFGVWLPGASVGSKMQSFPSAHTATAVGLAAGLAWLYPRGRWLFFLFAALVGCQRIQSGAHFLSDVLAGATLGSIVALGFFKCGWIPGLMDRLEMTIRGKGTIERESKASQ
jgi:undecaprenyl-diphosphatase